MNKYADILSRLPELPIELFELSSKLDFSRRPRDHQPA